MNCAIDFRFVTRTLKDDYYVYADSGNNILDDLSEFAPLRKTCGIISEDGGCAALFENGEDANIFLVVSGIETERKDFAGRPIRFSFCKIFNKDNKPEAYNAFNRVITQWQDMRLEIQNNFHEADILYFNQEAFINWLCFNQDLKLLKDFEICRHGDVRKINAVIWPAQDCMLKWLLAEDDEIFCSKIIINL